MGRLAKADPLPVLIVEVGPNGHGNPDITTLAYNGTQRKSYDCMSRKRVIVFAVGIVWLLGGPCYVGGVVLI